MLKWKEKDIETRCLVETEHEVSVRKAPRSFDRNQNKIGLCQVLKLPENFKLSEKRGESTRTKSDSNGSFISRQQLHFVLCDFFSFSFFFYSFYDGFNRAWPAYQQDLSGFILTSYDTWKLFASCFPSFCKEANGIADSLRRRCALRRLAISLFKNIRGSLLY